MGTVVLVKTVDAPVPDSPGKWYRRQLISQAAFSQYFGYKEMPVKPVVTRTIQQINSEPSGLPIFTGVKAQDSGIVTRNGQNLSVEADDVLVSQYDDTFVNYGPRTEAFDLIHHFRVTDKDPEDLADFVRPETIPGATEEDPPTPVSRSKYKITEAGMTALANSDGVVEDVWANILPYFEDQYP